jgi:hypothetical protein
VRAAELQRAVYERLTGFSALTALVTGVYDHVPQTAALPYVVFGEPVTIPHDTDDTVGAEHDFVIHVWSDHRGQMETKEIQQQIYAALHRYNLQTSAGLVFNCECELQESFLDVDGLTRHGVQRFRVLMNEVM